MQTKDPIDSEIEAAIARTRQDVVRDKVRIKIMRERLDFWGQIGYLVALGSFASVWAYGFKYVWACFGVLVLYGARWVTLYRREEALARVIERAEEIKKMLEAEASSPSMRLPGRRSASSRYAREIVVCEHETTKPYKGAEPERNED